VRRRDVVLRVGAGVTNNSTYLRNCEPCLAAISGRLRQKAEPTQNDRAACAGIQQHYVVPLARRSASAEAAEAPRGPPPITSTTGHGRGGLRTTLILRLPPIGSAIGMWGASRGAAFFYSLVPHQCSPRAYVATDVTIDVAIRR
jgi:hypothetical protein